MKQEGKYRPLFDRLSSNRTDEVTLSLTEIEAILGDALPPSARTTRGWWGNRDRGSLQAAAWMEAGYQVQEVDLAAGRVVFRKPRRQYEVKRAGGTVLWNGDLVRALRDHMGASQAQLAENLGVRQQTVSEWENDAYLPTRATSKFLSLVAERAGFNFGNDETREEGSSPNSS
ncbi:MAG: helix-turn-helix transcriptional regulator [Chloroflexi bacterium]|nr:helix-turn-helix transcriptional regulator [Chloroflexota bacterium]